MALSAFPLPSLISIADLRVYISPNRAPLVMLAVLPPPYFISNLPGERAMLAYFCHTITWYGMIWIARGRRFACIQFYAPFLCLQIFPSRYHLERSTALTLNEGLVHAFFSFCGGRQPGWFSGYWVRDGAHGERAKLAGARSQLELLYSTYKDWFWWWLLLTGTSAIDKHTAYCQAYQLVVDLIYCCGQLNFLSRSIHRPRHVLSSTELNSIAPVTV